MIPLQDIIPTRTRPIVTLSLIGLNVGGFLIQRVGDFETLPLALSFFVHNGLLVFAVNVIFLWLFGGSVEDQVGRWRFAVLYGLCGSAAVLTALLLDPSMQPHFIGASGAIAGIVGAYFMIYHKSRVLVFVPFPISLHEIPAIFFLGVWVVLQTVGLIEWRLPFDTNDADIATAVLGQMAAFAGGALACRLLRRPERARVEWWAP